MSDETIPTPDETPNTPAVPPTDASPEGRSPAGKTPTEINEAPESELNSLEKQVIAVLETIFDPEIPVNICELGLIYGIEVDTETGKVDIEMTLTTPACPVAGSLPGEVETKVKTVEGVTDATVELVWDPPWTMERLSEAAKLTLGVG